MPIRFRLSLDAVRVLAVLLLALPSLLQAFTHPGLAHTAADLDRIRSLALGGAEPWNTAWSLSQQFAASPAYQPSPVVNETIGVGEFQIRNDAVAAWQLALRWYVSGDVACRDAAINIIKAWTTTLQTFDPADNLSASRAAIGFCNAAEILIHGGAPWPQTDVDSLKAMMLNLIYPAMNEAKIDSMKGNQGIDAMSGLMAVAVFCDDQAKFDYVVEAYKNHPNCAVTAYIRPSGQSGEHGRDQAHPTGGLGAFDEIARMALNQGVELYSWSDNRLLAGYEFWSKYNLGLNDLPFESWGVYTYTSPSQIDRGRLSFVNFESIYDVYITRRGLASPYFEQAATRMRPDPWGIATLRFYTGPAVSPARLIPSGTFPIISRFNNLAIGSPANSSVNGTQLSVEPYDARTSQRWAFTHLGMNIYSVVNAQNKTTDIPGADENTGTKVQLYTPNAGVHQRWRAIANDDGTLALLNLNSSMGLTIADDIPASGGLLIQGTIFPDPRLAQRWTVAAPSPTPPAAPAVVSARSLTGGSISLTWDYVALASGYTVKRSLAYDGPYTTLISNLASRTYQDDAVVIGTTYYYTITPANPLAEGAPSTPFVASSGLPSPWLGTDLGTVGTAGVAAFDNQTSFEIKGAGGDIGGTGDSGHFLYRPLSGDGTLLARLDSASFVGTTGKIGLMIRESTASNSRMVALLLDRGASRALRSAFRSATSGNTSFPGIAPASIAAPVWLRLQRAGNAFTTSYSTDGSTWTGLATFNVTLATEVLAGAVVCSRATGLATGVFTWPPDTAPLLTLASANGKNTLQWLPTPRASAYTVERSLNAAGPFDVLADTLSALSYADTGLVNGVTYYYRVTGANAAATGPRSAVVASTPFSDFQKWKIASGLAFGLAANATPDNDGIALLLKYATGMMPGSPAQKAPASVLVSSNRLQLSFDRVRPAPVTYEVEASDDLVGWQTIARLATDSELWTGAATVTETDVATNLRATLVTENTAPGPRRFLRLKVSEPGP